MEALASRAMLWLNAEAKGEMLGLSLGGGSGGGGAEPAVEKAAAAATMGVAVGAAAAWGGWPSARALARCFLMVCSASASTLLWQARRGRKGGQDRIGRLRLR